MASIIQRSFAGGEISPALYGRADQVKYQTGLKKCRNFIVQRFGGVTNRPGTQFIAETKSSGKARLLKFVFNADAGQAYVLVFTNLAMRVIKGGAQLEASPGVPYELVTTYAAADLDGLQFVQSADVVTIGGLSAHAGQDLLVKYALAARDQLKQVILVHGETDAINAFARPCLLQGRRTLMPSV